MTFPKGQKVVLTYYYNLQNKETYYIVTQDRVDKFYLYFIENDKSHKLKAADCPLDFKEVYPD